MRDNFVTAISTGSFSISTWINGENTLAAYRSLYLNRFWERWIKTDNSGKQTPISDVFVAVFAAGINTSFTSYCLFSSFNHIEHGLSPERINPYAKNWLPNPRGPYFYAALLLTVLNTAKIFADNIPMLSPREAIDKFLVGVARVTPYLMIIANIAVTIIQISRGESSAWVTLAVIGITWIDTTSWKPAKYDWYLNTVLGNAVPAGALYYADNELRKSIISQVALQIVIRKMQK